MAIYKVGSDIISVERVKTLIINNNEWKLGVFTPSEISYCENKINQFEHFAGRLAAKEAVVKALGSDFSSGMVWTDVEIVNTLSGKPHVLLHGNTKRIADDLGVKQLTISISLSQEYVVAQALIRFLAIRGSGLDARETPYSKSTLWQRILHRFFPHRNVSSKGLIIELYTKLEALENSHTLLLNKLEQITDESIPKNRQGLYKISPARMTYYLNELVPQVYLTLVSVLQGVALAILADQFRFNDLSTNPLEYFYFASSFLIIVNFWYAFQTVIFIRRWPLRFIDAFIYFAAAITQSIAYKNVLTPHYWFMGIASMCFIFVFAYARQISIIRVAISADLYDIELRQLERQKATINTYIVFFLLTTILAASLSRITLSNSQNLPAAIVALAGPIMYTIIAIREARNYEVYDLG